MSDSPRRPAEGLLGAPAWTQLGGETLVAPPFAQRRFWYPEGMGDLAPGRAALAVAAWTAAALAVSRWLASAALVIRPACPA
jgi:hypothetical protein